YLARRGPAVDRLGSTGTIAIVAGCGAPMVLLVNIGLLFASAARGGAVLPGIMPLMVVVLGAIMPKEQLRSGLLVVAIGAVGIVWGKRTCWWDVANGRVHSGT